MNILEISLQKAMRLPVRPQTIIVRIDSEARIDTNARLFQLYETNDFVELSSQTAALVTLRYYDFAQQDNPSLSKLFFELVSVNQDSLTTDEKRGIQHLIVQISFQLRKYTQAMDFAGRVADKEGRMLNFLLLGINFDFSMRSKDACRCFLRLLADFSGEQEFQTRLEILEKLPNINAQFDLSCLVQEYSIVVFELIKETYLKTAGSLTSQKGVALLTLMDILLESDCANWLANREFAAVLNHFLMDKRYAGNQDVEIVCQKITQTARTGIEAMRLSAQLGLLATLFQAHMGNTGFVFQVVQLLIQQATTDLRAPDADPQIGVSQETKVLLSQALVKKYLFFNQNQRLPAAQQITESIVVLLASLGIGQAEFVSLVLTNFWSQNEFVESYCGDVFYQEPLRLNRYLAADLLEVVHILGVHGRHTCAQQYYDDFCTSALFGFNVRIAAALRQEETLAETELSPGQAFGVAEAMYHFALQFAPRALLLYLEGHYFPRVAEFCTGYVGSEVLLYQLDAAIGDYFNVVSALGGEVSYGLLFSLLDAMANWVEYQIYDIYFSILAGLLQTLRLRTAPEALHKLLQKVLRKLALSAIVPSVLLEEVVTTILYLEQKHNIETFQSLSDCIYPANLSVDLQFVSQVTELYLRNCGQLGMFSASKADYALGLLTQYRPALFGVQAFTYAGSLFGSLLAYCLWSDEVLNALTYFQRTKEVYGRAPRAFLQACVEKFYAFPNLMAQVRETALWINLAGEISRYQPCKELDAAFYGLQILQPEPLQCTPSESLLASRPSSANIQRMQQSDRHAGALRLEDIPQLPSYQDVEALKTAVQVPGVPFTFLIPHPSAKEQRKLVDLNELADDIGTLDVLDDEKLEQFVDKKERPMSSCNVRREEGELGRMRPQSAGPVGPEDVIPEVALQTPKRHIGQSLRPNISLEFEDWEEDAEEENLLDKLDAGETL